MLDAPEGVVEWHAVHLDGGEKFLDAARVAQVLLHDEPSPLERRRHLLIAIEHEDVE